MSDEMDALLAGTKYPRVPHSDDAWAPMVDAFCDYLTAVVRAMGAKGSNPENGAPITATPERESWNETRKQRRAALIAEAERDGYALPGDSKDRAMCKVLRNEGVFEPNGCLGYRLTRSST